MRAMLDKQEVRWKCLSNCYTHEHIDSESSLIIDKQEVMWKCLSNCYTHEHIDRESTLINKKSRGNVYLNVTHEQR
jgi:hypothetical protein